MMKEMNVRTICRTEISLRFGSLSYFLFWPNLVTVPFLDVKIYEGVEMTFPIIDSHLGKKHHDIDSVVNN